MGRRRRDGSHSPQKDNSIQDSVGNEENGYTVSDLNKTMINVLCVMHTKKPSKKKSLRNSLEKILDMVSQNVQDALKKFQDTKNKEHEMTQKQIKELKQDFNKYQSETKDTIKREIHELKRTTQIKKEELNQDVENLRRIKQKSWK
jgi:hypothetical protein